MVIDWKIGLILCCKIKLKLKLEWYYGFQLMIAMDLINWMGDMYYVGLHMYFLFFIDLLVLIIKLLALNLICIKLK